MLLCNVVGELLGPPWVTDAQVRFSHDCHNYMISENSEMTREPNDLPTDTCDKWSKKGSRDGTIGMFNDLPTYTCDKWSER